MVPSAFFFSVAFLCSVAALSQEFTHFDTKDTTESPQAAPGVTPWRVIELEPTCGGSWVVAGDIDGDGEIEIVSAENVNDKDVHYTSAVAAQNLDGSVLWTWGDPDIGRKELHHDVACQIHDWDGDGVAEVVVVTKSAVVELDGKTGAEKRRIDVPDGAWDCLTFCDLAGKGRPTDVLVKNRYDQIWAYSAEGKLLWTSERPGGCRTAHQACPIDLDGDGRDEIVAGYATLNPDGSVRWVYKSERIKGGGHLDCMRVLRAGGKPEDWRLALTCCGAKNLAVVDGNGKIIWEVSGHHFESIQIGRIVPDVEGPQILVDIDHMPMGNGPMWVLDQNGTLLGRLVTDYSRQHRLIDWNGDGFDEILAAHAMAIYDHAGKRLASLEMPESPAGEHGTSVLVGDMTGDGVPDVLAKTPSRVYLYRNESGKAPTPPAPLGSGLNFTFY